MSSRRSRVAAGLLAASAAMSLSACASRSSAPSTGAAQAPSAANVRVPAPTRQTSVLTTLPVATPVRGSQPAPDVGTGGLAGRTIVLDPGHNGLTYMYPDQANALVPAGGFRKACNTTGTSTNAGYSEHAFNWALALRTAALLRVRGARVVLTRPDDAGVGPCVNQRAAITNSSHALVVISLHADGGPSTGYGFHVIEAGLAPDGGNRAFLSVSHRLALDVRAGYRAATGESYATYLGQQGLDRRSDLAGLNLARIPAVFIECGNMRNRADAAKLSSGEFQQRAAVGLVTAIEDFAAGR